MISVQEAYQLIQQQQQNFGVEQVPLLQAAGRILAQQVVADRDFPPYNRVMMDGIAIQKEAFAGGQRSFPVAGVQAAGQPVQQLTNPQHCLEVMTGAMLPIDTDVVIRYEDCIIENDVATVHLAAVDLFQNVHQQGNDTKAGYVLVQENQPITPGVIAVMATVGLSTVDVYRLPKIAVCATGDELVEVNQQPLPHQIRQSNSYMLAAALLSDGIVADRYHLIDEPDEMRVQLENIISQYDTILFSGAVSKGKFDYLPQVLQDLGMQQIFHSIAQRPGKPFLFGSFADQALVFAFPGNPVSTFVCFELYFKAWLYKSLHRQQQTLQAHLTQPVIFKPELSYHIPARLTWHEGEAWVTPVDMSGSGDITALLQANALITLPAYENVWEENDLVSVTALY
jgi:molybdopterin molybdotransferase